MKNKFFDNIQIATLIESIESGNKYRCIIIRPGVTSSANTFAMHEGRKVAVKKNYPKEVLKAAANNGFFEGVPMILRSEHEHLSQQNQDINQIVGYFTETAWNEEANAVVGTFNLKRSNALSSSFKTYLKDIWESTKNVGLSITGMGEWIVQQVANGYEALVTSLENITSIDPCRVGNAGGKIIDLMESELTIKNNLNNQTNYKMDSKQKTALFLFLQSKGKIKSDAMESEFSDEQLLDAATARDMADFYREHKPEVVTPPVVVSSDASEPEGGIKEKVLDRLILEGKKMQAEAALTKILNESKLNPKAKDQIFDRIKKNEFVYNVDDVKRELVQTAKLLNEASDSAFFRGVSKQFDSRYQDIKLGTEVDDKYALGLQWLLSNQAVRNNFSESEKKQFQEAGVTGLNSMAEFYKQLTGDYGITGQEGKGKLAEAITSATYPQLLKDSMNKTVLRAYKMSAYEADWRKVVSIVPRQNFLANTIIYTGGYSNLMTVAEGAIYTPFTSPGEQANQYSITKKGNLESITREAMKNDNLAFFQKIPFLIGETAARSLYEFVFNLIFSNPVMLYDTLPLFDAGHNNMGTTALSSASYSAGRSAMIAQTDLTNAKPLGYMPKFLIVPPALEDLAYQLTTPAFGVNNNVPSFNQTWAVEPIMVPTATDANNWHLVGDPLRGVPTIEIGFLDGQQEPEIFLQDQPTVGEVFTNDKITFKVRHEYNGAIENHRGFYGGIVVNPP